MLEILIVKSELQQAHNTTLRPKNLVNHKLKPNGRVSSVGKPCILSLQQNLYCSTIYITDSMEHDADM